MESKALPISQGHLAIADYLNHHLGLDIGASLLVALADFYRYAPNASSPSFEADHDSLRFMAADSTARVIAGSLLGLALHQDAFMGLTPRIAPILTPEDYLESSGMAKPNLKNPSELALQSLYILTGSMLEMMHHASEYRQERALDYVAVRPFAWLLIAFTRWACAHKLSADAAVYLGFLRLDMESGGWL